MQNFDRHGVYVEVSEVDQLPSWNIHSRRASEVIDMMWVLKKKRDEKSEILKYKARAVVCGNQQKRKERQQAWSTPSRRSHRLRARLHSNCCV
eukprot:1223604-Pleurochrysis_carterae.AAC.1